MDNNFLIQSLKTQIMNFNSQIDNIISQNNNLFIMSDNKIGDQLLNLSIQMINTGIQAFNIGKNIVINNFNYFEQLKLISQQINSLINENNYKIQQQMMQQQQMMAIQQQMMAMQQNQIFMSKPEIYNIVFKTTFVSKNCKKVINIQEGSTVEELLNQFKDKVKDLYSYEQINNMKFFSSTNYVGRLYGNDKRKIDKNFRGIIVLVE